MKGDKNRQDNDGFTEHLFGLRPLLGIAFMPRLKDLPDQVFSRIDRDTDYGALQPLLRGRINMGLILEQWDQLVRLAASLKDRLTPAHVVMQRLANANASDRLAGTLTQLGRLMRTIHILRYIHEAPLRDAIQLQLNRGEFRHILAKSLFFANQGGFHSGDYKEMMNKDHGKDSVCAFTQANRRLASRRDHQRRAMVPACGLFLTLRLSASLPTRPAWSRDALAGGGAVHGARDVRKAHTNPLYGFSPFPGGPLGAASPAGRRPLRLCQHRCRAGHGHGGHGVQGSVLAGMGNGNASRATLDVPTGAAHRSMAVVRATRIGEGLIERVVSDLDVALGSLVARDLSLLPLQLLIGNGLGGYAERQRAFGTR